MFQSRYKLFKFAYLNSVAQAIDLMTIDAFLEANLYYNFKEIINDAKEYWKLTDYILAEIIKSDNPELKRAKDILMKIKYRDLYKFISEVIISSGIDLPEVNIIWYIF